MKDATTFCLKCGAKLWWSALFQLRAPSWFNYFDYGGHSRQDAPGWPNSGYNQPVEGVTRPGGKALASPAARPYGHLAAQLYLPTFYKLPFNLC